MALVHGTSTVFHPKIEGSMVSYTPKSQSLKFKLCPHLTSLHSFQRGGSILRYGLKSTSRNLREPQALVIISEYPQNSDFPQNYSRKEKKPCPVPIVELRRAARARFKKSKGKPKGKVPPPKNGLVVQSLIPLAYDVYNERVTLINNLKKLLKVMPVQSCGWCSEIHVGHEGHPFKSCKGKYATIRKGLHEWTYAALEDVFVPIEAYHLFDRLGKRIPHEERFTIPRIPALVELCLQAGVNIPEYPTKRRRKPIIHINKSEFIDADESELPNPVPEISEFSLLTEIPTQK